MASRTQRMTHIVTGFRRSGTSMMMRALIVGGMDALYDEVQDEHLQKGADEFYHLQHGESVYEPAPHRFREWNFPLPYEGKLIKVLFGGLGQLAPNPNGYRYVFMLRDPEEIAQSDEARMIRARAKAPPWLRDGGYERRMALAQDVLANRRDTLSVSVLNYVDVCDSPLATFEALRAAGWPIDPAKAAEVPDPALRRFRREELVEVA